jgi:tripartite-type tricarboxylate transporter receptor subunit TctC
LSAACSKLAPDLPTIHEAGVSGYELVGWIAMFAPAQTPEPIIARINAEVRQILADAEFAAGLAAVGIETAPTTPEELRAFVVSETAKWSEIAKAAGIEPQ